MKLLFTWLFVIPFATLFAKDSTSCRILLGLLNNKDAQRVFYFDDYKHLPIVFIDRKSKFNHCKMGRIHGKEIEIIHDSAYVNQTAISYVIIHNMKKKGHRKYEIEIQQKATGAYGFIEFKKVGNEFMVSKFSVGYI